MNTGDVFSERKVDMRYEVKDNAIYFIREGEWGRISACGRNSIRFQASPSGPVKEQNWTLMPGEAAARAWLEEDTAILETGDMRVKQYGNGSEVGTVFFHK